jgi:hypothetical protein
MGRPSTRIRIHPLLLITSGKTLLKIKIIHCIENFWIAFCGIEFIKGASTLTYHLPATRTRRGQWENFFCPLIKINCNLADVYGYVCGNRFYSIFNSDHGSLWKIIHFQEMCGEFSYADRSGVDALIEWHFSRLEMKYEVDGMSVIQYVRFVRFNNV